MGCAKTGSRSDLVHSCNLLATALEQLINLGCSLESSATLGKVPGLVSGHSDSGGLFGTKDSTVKAGFKNPHSEDLLNLPPLRNSHYVFPFQAFITLHLHSGNNFYLWFHSRLSLINLLHCHISYLASNLPKVPLPAGQCSYSVASHTMVLYLDFWLWNNLLTLLVLDKTGYLQFTLCYFFSVYLGFCWSHSLKNTFLLAMSTCLSK